MPNLNFSIKAKSENPTKTIVEARDFKLIVDEPQNVGGTDYGPNPVEYVLAALAGCLNVVGHLVAKDMGFEVNGIDIEIDGDLNPARFMGQDVETRAGYESIRVKLTPNTDADKDTLDKWVEAVEHRCPVSDNLSNATSLEISIG